MPLVVSKANRPSRFSVVLLRLLLANIGMIAAGYIAAKMLLSDHPRAQAFVSLGSLALWVSLPIGVTYYFRSLGWYHGPCSQTAMRRALLLAITVGLVSSADLLLVDRAQGICTFLLLQVVCAAFSIAAATLSVNLGPPLPFLEIGARTDEPSPGKRED